MLPSHQSGGAVRHLSPTGLSMRTMKVMTMQYLLEPTNHAFSSTIDTLCKIQKQKTPLLNHVAEGTPHNAGWRRAMMLLCDNLTLIVLLVLAGSCPSSCRTQRDRYEVDCRQGHLILGQQIASKK